MREKYPPIECEKSAFLSVGSHHEIYWEESGNPEGLPVLFLHGGPGAGTDPGHRRYFDPKGYRIILMDQRGSGKSKPHSSLVDNTTWHLISDIEELRKTCKIEKWVVFGGSWGSTLALCYAISHPQRVLSLILRGIFLGREKELHWFYQEGAHYIFPDQYEKYIEIIPPEERQNLIEAYYKRLTSDDPKERKIAASRWSSWEGSALRLIFDPKAYEHFTQDEHADALARLECHYFINKCFFPSENWILENIGKIEKISAIIVQGRYDIVCPMLSAYELKKAWPQAELIIVKDAGHAASEPGIVDALIDATDRTAQKFH